MAAVNPRGPMIPSPETKEYTIEGGVSIRDRTNGIVTAVFDSKFSETRQKSVYKIFIHGKKLIRPTFSNPASDSLIFIGSLIFTFKPKENGFIKITEVDANGQEIYYVDSTNSVEGIAYDGYHYMPKVLSLEDARRKIEHLQTDFPDFKADIAIYNRHGVAVFGCTDRGYALYWADPYQERVSQMECASCSRLRDGGSSFAKSKDGSVNFRSLFGKGEYLNAEPATRISLTT